MRPLEYSALLLCSFLVSFANAISHGQYLEPALGLLAIALAVLIAVFGSRLRSPASEPSPSRLLSWLTWVALASMPVTALCDPKVIAHAHGSRAVLRGIEVASILLLATYLPFLGGRREARGARRARFAGFFVLTLAMGIAVIVISPAPVIDVWGMQMRAAEALLHGENPYATVLVPTTSGVSYSTPGHVVTAVPFVYAPGTFFAGALGILIGRDVRYAMLLAVLVTGLAVRALSRPSAPAARAVGASLVEDAPALFVWLMPLLAMVVELSWTDPVQLMFIAIAVLAYARERTLGAAVAVGLALATKQTMLWLLPLAGVVFCFRPRDWVAMLAAALVPLAAYAASDWPAFRHGAIDYQVALPPRADALCLAVWLKTRFGVTLPTAVAPAGALAVLVAAASRSRSLGGSGPGVRAARTALFARAAALTYFVFFFFNKWAFANYYYLIAGLAALAAAAALREAAGSPVAE
jgi:hypothetical protein